MEYKIIKNNITLSFDFDKSLVASCKRLSMKWSKANKLWYMPDTLLNRACLYRVFPKLKPGGLNDYDMTVSIPSYLMQHQGAAKIKASEYNRYGFFWDTGVGKTACALEIIKLHNVKTLIVCPLSLIESAWQEDIDKFCPEIKVANLWKARKRHPKFLAKGLESQVCIINFESFRNEVDNLKKAGFKMLIVDESSCIKEPKSQITKKLTDFSETVKYCYLLSGTPAPNGLHEYFTQIRMIDPLLWGKSFFKWKSIFFYQSGYGGYKLTVKPDMEEKLMSDISKVSEVIRKEDVLDLPGYTNNKRIFSLCTKERKAYREIVRDLKAVLDDGHIITAAMAVTKIMKLRQISSGFLLNEGETFNIGNSKLMALKALLEEIGNKQVIIWTEFINEANNIIELLKSMSKSHGACNGQVAYQDKMDNIVKFKNNEIQYLIAHPKTIAHGVTFTNCSYTIYYSNSYSYELSVQTKGRIYRKGQGLKCSYYYLLAADTMDADILTAINKKQKIDMAIIEYLKKTSEKA